VASEAAIPDVLWRFPKGAALSIETKLAHTGPAPVLLKIPRDAVVWRIPRDAMVWSQLPARRASPRRGAVGRGFRSRSARTRSHRSAASTRARAPDDGGGGDPDPDDAAPRGYVGERNYRGKLTATRGIGGRR
jgi:hypothetical protein